MDFVPCSLFGIHLPELLWYVPCTPHGSYFYIAILLYCYIAIATPSPSFPLSATLPSPPFLPFTPFQDFSKLEPYNAERQKAKCLELTSHATHVQKKQAKKRTRRKNDLLVSYNTLIPLHHLFDWKPRPGIWSGTPSRQSSSFRSIPPIVFEFLASGRSTMIGKCERAGPPAYYVGCSSTYEESAARAFEENVL